MKMKAVVTFNVVVLT